MLTGIRSGTTSSVLFRGRDLAVKPNDAVDTAEPGNAQDKLVADIVGTVRDLEKAGPKPDTSLISRHARHSFMQGVRTLGLLASLGTPVAATIAGINAVDYTAKKIGIEDYYAENPLENSMASHTRLEELMQAMQMLKHFLGLALAAIPASFLIGVSLMAGTNGLTAAFMRLKQAHGNAPPGSLLDSVREAWRDWPALWAWQSMRTRLPETPVDQALLAEIDEQIQKKVDDWATRLPALYQEDADFRELMNMPENQALKDFLVMGNTQNIQQKLKLLFECYAFASLNETARQSLDSLKLLDLRRRAAVLMEVSRQAGDFFPYLSRNPKAFKGLEFKPEGLALQARIEEADQYWGEVKACLELQADKQVEEAHAVNPLLADEAFLQGEINQTIKRLAWRKITHPKDQKGLEKLQQELQALEVERKEKLEQERSIRTRIQEDGKVAQEALLTLKSAHPEGDDDETDE